MTGGILGDERKSLNESQVINRCFETHSFKVRCLPVFKFKTDPSVSGGIKITLAILQISHDYASFDSIAMEERSSKSARAFQRIRAK